MANFDAVNDQGISGTKLDVCYEALYISHA